MAMKEMEKMKKAGIKYPKELEKRLKEIQSSDFENLSQKDLYKINGTIESLIMMSKDHSFDSSQIEDDDDLPVNCLCVHGECDKGSSKCSGKCYSGWVGRMCDVPEDYKKSNADKRTKGK